MDKNIIKERLLSLEEKELMSSREAYLNYVSAAHVDADEPFDDGALSQAERARFLAEGLECPLHSHLEKIEILNRIDFGPKSRVEAGAVVKFGGRRFVIAVSTAVFSCEGQDLMGISTHAPIYEEMADLAAGDTFAFKGRQIVIQEVM